MGTIKRRYRARANRLTLPKSAAGGRPKTGHSDFSGRLSGGLGSGWARGGSGWGSGWARGGGGGAHISNGIQNPCLP